MNTITDLEPLGLPGILRARLDPSQSVLDQAIPWNRETWTERFTQELRANEERRRYVEAIERLATRCAKRVSRSAVIGFMKEDTIDGFLAAMIWGFGTTGYGPYRTAQIIAGAGDLKTLTAKLNGIRAASLMGHNEARRAMVGDCKLTGLGPAFGTKVAYFAARTVDPLPDRPIPLIADFFTSRAFWHLTGNVGSVGTADGYDRYVHTLHTWSRTSDIA